MHRVTGMSDDERGRLHAPALAPVGSGAPEDDSLQDGRAGPGVLRDGIESDLGQQRQPPPRDGASPASQEPSRWGAEGQSQQQRCEGGRTGWNRVIQDGHLDQHPAHAFGCQRRELEGDVRPQRGTADHSLVQLQVIEQRKELLGEGRHRVAPHVARAIRGPVSEGIEGDYAVTVTGQAPRQRQLHLLREQQPGQQHRAPIALPVDRVGKPLTVVGEEGHHQSG